MSLSEKMVSDVGGEEVIDWLKVDDVKEFIRLCKELDDLYENNKITWEGLLIRKKELAGDDLK